VVHDADVVLDLVGGDTLKRSFMAIKKGGRVVTVATNAESSKDPAVKTAFFIVETRREQLIELAKLIDSGKIRPIISEVFPLEKADQAYFSARKKAVRGKSVIRVSTS
jgi:NADPH:quinone reductase-like Zn-dependent oxidoreductase